MIVQEPQLSSLSIVFENKDFMSTVFWQQYFLSIILKQLLPDILNTLGYALPGLDILIDLTLYLFIFWLLFSCQYLVWTVLIN